MTEEKRKDWIATCKDKGEHFWCEGCSWIEIEKPECYISHSNNQD